jgi:hypothetical protein
VREKDGHRPPNKNGRSYPLLGVLDDEELIEMRQRVDQPDRNLFASPPFRAPRARREISALWDQSPYSMARMLSNGLADYIEIDQWQSRSKADVAIFCAFGMLA